MSEIHPMGTAGVRFSVVMPSYNRQEVILKSLDSVRRQNYGDRVEVVIVDDSTDQTLVRIQNYSQQHPDLKITWFRPGSRAGISGARNMAIERAKGEYVVMMDSDDEFIDGALEWIDGILQKYNCAIYFGGVTCKSGHPVEYTPGYRDRVLTFEEYLQIYDNPESLPVIKTELLRKHSLSYDTDLSGFEGLLYLRLLKLGYGLFRDTKPVRLFDDLDREDRHSNAESVLKISEKMARGHARFLMEYKNDLREIAPLLYWKTVVKTIVYAKLAGVEQDEPFRRGVIAQGLRLLPRSLLWRLVLSYKRGQ